MNLIKIILFNVFILFSLLGILLLSPPIIYSIYKIVNNENIGDTFDNRYKLKIYLDYEWAEEHFQEYNNLTTTYFDYITWRRDDFDGKTIKIENGIRKTFSPEINDKNKDEFWFFGGSTMWGTGVTNELSIPSLFALQNNTNVINFAETGYTSRQSLAYLTNYLISKKINNLKNIHVVFYDGVNDVVSGCRKEKSGFGTIRETQIREQIGSGQHKYSFKRTFGQVQDVLISILGKFKIHDTFNITKDVYNCDVDNLKANNVANSLIETWNMASKLVESYGGTFTAVLQPVAYYGNSDYGYLQLDKSIDRTLRNQYKNIYPRIIELLIKSNFNSVNLIDAFDNCDNCYIDFCHTGPKGNEILSNKLSKNIYLS
tara:strand:- start:131 stop:1246 length:1116 start_codon:yes stop_codon:yes gene_type:complete